ncbi:MAG TPA: AmmeMemoRadiSam system protein B [Roseiarcus sp.]|nr:AmmeMemoRadiSam system protein B [Roseiarcus sp.]
MPRSEIHPAQAAGMFYPADPDALRTLIADLRTRARPDGSVAPKVVVAPHAGLVYSGSVAATAFGPWARRAEPPRRIVIAGPAHRVAFRGIAVHPATKWRTPLGETPVAPVAHAELAETHGVFVDPRPFEAEHSLEMHLIMLQAMLPAPFEIIPLLVGDADPHTVAEALRRVWGGPETVVAISSDLSHFLDRRSAESIDSSTARLVETLDAAALDGRRACGFLPIQGALEIAAERDMRASALHLATSADVGADASRVVGYGAFALEYAASARLAETDREILLSACMAALGLATQAGGKAPAASLNPESPALSSWRATFVTLTENERLRGCIGSLAPNRPLIEDALANTAKAGFADPRFPPLKEFDLEGLRLDVSILSHPRPIPAASESELASALEPDRDGLILTAGERRALFLPSVWRQALDSRAFVRHLMAKAGFETNHWPHELEAKRFRVESFGAPWRRVDSQEIVLATRPPSPVLH